MLSARGRALCRAAILGLLTALSGCAAVQSLEQRVAGGETPPVQPQATWPVPPGPGPALTPIGYTQIPGWRADQAAEALAVFLAGCDQMRANPVQPLGGEGEAAARGGTPAQWQSACAAARAVPPGDDAAARGFFEAQLQPYGVSSDGSAIGLYTGYYEPEVRGSRVQTPEYRYPIYRRPPELPPGRPAHPFMARAEIERGGLARRHLELVWLASPIDAYFMHVQGSGRIRLPDGSAMRVTYDGQNGQTYVPIGRVLVDRGEMTLDQVTMQSIRAWMEAHPDQDRGLMNQNPSYVFFRELTGFDASVGPPSALGPPLTPMRSVAVDRNFTPLGTPVWIDTRDPTTGAPLRRLMMAQDLGGAIRGPARADIFFGWGDAAEDKAGRMRQTGIEIILLPKGTQAAAL